MKPDLFKHDELFEAEHETGLPLRIAFVGLFTVCDREGRFAWRPRRLKIEILPYDDIDFTRVLDALKTRGFLVHYENSGVEYGCIPSFTSHQMINNKEQASSIPSVESGDSRLIKSETLVNTQSEPEKETDISRVADAIVTREGNSQGEGKGREGKGKEGVASYDACPAVAEPMPTDSLPDQPAKPNRSGEISTVFEHWQTVFNHPQAKLDDKRKRYIRQALKSGYTVIQLKQAIDGCSRTPHNIGQNDRGQVYDGIHVIFRDADQIDRFIRNADQPAVAQMSKAGRVTQASAKAVMAEMFGEGTHGR